LGSAARAQVQPTDTSINAQEGSGVIAQYQVYPNGEGKFANYQPNGATSTDNAFFQSLGTNGRACVSCHQLQDGLSITPSHIAARFETSNGSDPIFRLVDGATCPNADVSTSGAQRAAYSLLLNKGLIRVERQVPGNAQFTITAVDDPYKCSDISNGKISVYRRPLPATNIRFAAVVMWDGREPSLASQATNATLIHAQAASGPSADQVNQIVQFQRGMFTAQVFSNEAGPLDANGSLSGPRNLAGENFAIGENDPTVPASFNPLVFTLYQAWLDSNTDSRAAIARGEDIFNNRVFTIDNVAGLNDDHFGGSSIQGTCSTCHNAFNVGNNSIPLFLNTGVSAADQRTSDLPLFTLRCNTGPLKHQTFQTTDPGRAMVTGLCTDIGKMKVPNLRGIEARSPYFHNGTPQEIQDVVNFYNNRFRIGLSAQDISDVTSFLQTL